MGINRPGSRQGVEPLGRRVCEWGGVPGGGQRQRPQSPPALILVPESKQVDSGCLSLGAQTPPGPERKAAVKR